MILNHKVKKTVQLKALKKNQQKHDEVNPKTCREKPDSKWWHVYILTRFAWSVVIRGTRRLDCNFTRNRGLRQRLQRRLRRHSVRNGIIQWKRHWSHWLKQGQLPREGGVINRDLSRLPRLIYRALCIDHIRAKGCAVTFLVFWEV